MKKFLYLALLIGMRNLFGSVIFNGNQPSSMLKNKINQNSFFNGPTTNYFGNNASLLIGTSIVGAIRAGNPFEEYDEINKIAIQADGKIIVVGKAQMVALAKNYIAVARFTKDGHLDTTFIGGNGTISFIPGTISLPSISGRTTLESDDSYSVSIQDDGKIVIGGTTFTPERNTCFALIRLNRDGSLDTSFTGGNGTVSVLPGAVYINNGISGVTTPGDIDDELFTIALQADGKIVAGGFTRLDGHNYAAVARFTDSGALDTSLNATVGSTTIIPGTAYINASVSNSSYPTDKISTIVLQADDTIVAGIITGDDGSNPYYFALAKFLANGSLDLAFVGGNGTTTFVPGTVCLSQGISGVTGSSVNDQLNQIVLTPSGKIIAGGSTINGDQFCALASFNFDGSLDTTCIGGNGSISSLPGTVWIPVSITGSDPESIIDQVWTIALQNDGKIVLAGTSLKYNENKYLFSVVRCNENGSLDTAFRGDEITTFTFLPGTLWLAPIFGAEDFQDQINSIAIRDTRTIVAGGFSQNNSGYHNFVLAQFFNPSTQCAYQKNYTSMGSALNC